MNNKNEWNIIILNDDEANRLKKISGDISHRLTLAHDAAVNTLHGPMAMKQYPRIDDPESYT